MKLNTRNTKRASGMTLLELTVVILVLLSLISILFIGARAWKRGADRAGCIMNVRNVQQAARSHANMQGIAFGQALLSTDLIGTDLYMANAPTCPTAGVAYSYLAVVPVVGTLYATCLDTNEAASHEPDSNLAAADRHLDW